MNPKRVIMRLEDEQDSYPDQEAATPQLYADACAVIHTLMAEKETLRVALESTGEECAAIQDIMARLKAKGAG